jgi:hypothetical protein
MNVAQALPFFLAAASLVSGCALRSFDVSPQAADAREFADWDCPRLQHERDLVQRRATRLAYVFDERAGNNIVAMGLGMSVFWPALLTMRSTQPEASQLAALKGRFDTLDSLVRSRACPPLERAAHSLGSSLAVGDVLHYQQRTDTRLTAQNMTLRVGVIHQAGLALAEHPAAITAAGTSTWQFDLSGNLLSAPRGPVWPQLLRVDLELGNVVAGELLEPNDSRHRARVRGQVVAVGPQVISGRSFDASVIDLFGDAQDEVASTRLDGVMVIDRNSGLLLRLDLNSAHPAFQLKRRLLRIESGP